MPKFECVFVETGTRKVVVEAKDKKEAESKAREADAKGELGDSAIIDRYVEVTEIGK